MGSSLSSLANRKQLLGAIVAAGILAAIFVPFQTAEAATLTVSIPTTFNQSTAGQAFSLTFNIGPSEVVGLDAIHVITDHADTAKKKVFTFDAAGNLISGTPASMISNIVVSPPPGTITGSPYGYGYGSGISTGYVGPKTVTITGTLKTSLLVTGTSPSTHTIDAEIDTGTGSVISNVVTFTVNPVATIGTSFVPGGGGTKTVTVNTPSGNTIVIQITNVNTGGNVVVVKKTKAEIKLEIPAIFTTTTSTTGTFSLGGTTFQTAGELFDIDLAGLGTPGVDFNFPVDITISYDDTGLTGAQEQQIKFMHWTGTAWQDVTAPIANNPNVGANTVTGRLNSLSPVVPAVSTTTTTTTGGGGGGGGRGPVVLDGILPPVPAIVTLPESHFLVFPLDRFQVASLAFLNAAGASIAQAQVNQQVSISGQFSNYQQKAQEYAFIVQVTDENDFTTYIAWQIGSLESGSTEQISMTWTPDADGTYTVKIFIWNEVGLAPEPLSQVTVKNIAVAE